MFRLGRHSFLVIAYALVLVVAIARFTIPTDVGFDTSAGNFWKFFPLLHLPQFIFGMALGRLFLTGPKMRVATSNAMLVAGAIGLALVFGAGASLPPWLRSDAVLVLLFSLVIFGGAGGKVRALTTAPMLLLGEASYAMYILHMPIGWLWNWAIRPFGLPELASFVGYFCLVIGASVVTYLCIERPARRWMLGHKKHHPAAP